MTTPTENLRQSALVMRLIGWGLIIGSAFIPLTYAPGFLWGILPPGFPLIGPPHPDSPYDAFHPYLFMLGVMYLAWAILLIRGAKDPRANAALFDYGILANVLHGGVMIPQSFIYPNEHAHMWADVPMLFVVAAVLWVWHPTRGTPDTLEI